ncbi:unnamed protein product [Discosporangium mesarthrocarpum]
MLVDCKTRQACFFLSSVLRMWKGVRDAQCGWIEVPETWDGQQVTPTHTASQASSNSSHHTTGAGRAMGVGAGAGAGSGAEFGSSGAGAGSQTIALYLAILAPQRLRVELWRMRHGTCARVISAPPGSRLVTVSPGALSSGEGMEARAVMGGGAGQEGRGLAMCYLLSTGTSGKRPRALRLLPIRVQEEGTVELPKRLSHDMPQDKQARLHKFRSTLKEMQAEVIATASHSLNQTPPEGMGSEETGAMGSGLPSLGLRLREEDEGSILEMLRGMECAESLALALTELDKVVAGNRGPGAPLDGSGRPINLGASFQHRLCKLCRERADEAEGVAGSAPERGGLGGRPALPMGGGWGGAGEEVPGVAALRFRDSVHQLYSLLLPVEVHPAGVAGEEEGDRAFLPPGMRGWVRAELCEEAAGWARMELGGVGVGVEGMQPGRELPSFQEFLMTAMVVLEPSQPTSSPSSAKFSQEAKSVRGKLHLPPPSGNHTVVAGPGRGRDGAGAMAWGEGKTSAGNLGDRHMANSKRKGEGEGRDGKEEEEEGRRCRRRLVGWLFRPLLSDAFAMASLSQSLSLLGLEGAAQTKLSLDLAEWFLSLPVGHAADITVKREARNCPVLRWLKGTILAAATMPSGTTHSPGAGAGPVAGARSGTGVGAGAGRREGSPRRPTRHGSDASSSKPGILGELGAATIELGDGQDVKEGSLSIGGGVPTRATRATSNAPRVWAGVEKEAVASVLEPIFQACISSPRLSNAMMLSVVVGEALAFCGEKLEERTLGQVVLGRGAEWAILARRLRVCLFLNHRLHHGKLGDKRLSILHLERGTSSIYACIAKDQLITYPDISAARCAQMEAEEVEASARAERQAREPFSSGEQGGEGEGRERPPALASSTLAHERMDAVWRQVCKAGNILCLYSSINFPFCLTVQAAAGHSSSTPPQDKLTKQLLTQSGPLSQTLGDTGSFAGVALAPGHSPQPPVTSLFSMRSHAQPLVLACHRVRWLVLLWAYASQPARGNSRGRGEEWGVAASRAGAGAGLGVDGEGLHALSLAVDHLGHIRSVNPVLAAFLAYTLWEGGGIRAHISESILGHARDAAGVGAKKAHVSGGAGGHELEDVEPEGGGLVTADRLTREAFLTAAAEFLRLDALFGGGGISGWEGRVGSGLGPRQGRGQPHISAEKLTLASILAGEVTSCPWPGVWDRWIEECLSFGKAQPPVASAVAAHSTLLQVLRVSTVCGMPSSDVPALFLESPKLCCEGSLSDTTLGPGAGEDEEGLYMDILARRQAFLQRALEELAPKPAHLVYRLAQSLGISEDVVRGWHCLILFQRGHDILGEEAMSHVHDIQGLAPGILRVMRCRLKVVLEILESHPGTSASILANLDADTCQWVRAASDQDLEGSHNQRQGERGARPQKMASQPLKSTHGVLLYLARALPPESRQKVRELRKEHVFAWFIGWLGNLLLPPDQLSRGAFLPAYSPCHGVAGGRAIASHSHFVKCKQDLCFTGEQSTHSQIF